MNSLSTKQSFRQPPLLLPATIAPTTDSIRRDTFKRLPYDIQLQYAIQYNLVDANTLTSDAICAILCTANEWIPALDIPGHSKFPTSNGLIIYNDVMDLVDILAVQPSNEASSYVVSSNSLHQHIAPVLNDGPQPTEPCLVSMSSTGLHSTVNASEETVKRLRQEIVESRRTVRATVADVFEFQTELAKEIPYHSRVIGLMADTIRRVATHRNETSKSSSLWDSQKIVSDAP
ncbi:hypothetical protein CVT25_003809, partial [Psilocybe cyanescens]